MIHIAWFNGKYTFKKFRFELERLVSNGHYLYNFLFTHPHIFVNMHHVLVFWDYCLLLWLLKKLMKIRYKALYKQTAKMSKTNCFCFWHLPCLAPGTLTEWWNQSVCTYFLRKANIEFWRFSLFCLYNRTSMLRANNVQIFNSCKKEVIAQQNDKIMDRKRRWLSSRGTIKPSASHDIYIHQMHLFRLCRAV